MRTDPSVSPRSHLHVGLALRSLKAMNQEKETGASAPAVAVIIGSMPLVTGSCCRVQRSYGEKLDERVMPRPIPQLFLSDGANGSGSNGRDAR